MSVMIDWIRLEADVVERIRALAAVSGDRLDAGAELREKIWTDLVLPNVRLLAEFCSNVSLSGEEPA